MNTKILCIKIKHLVIMSLSERHNNRLNESHLLTHQNLYHQLGEPRLRTDPFLILLRTRFSRLEGKVLTPVHFLCLLYKLLDQSASRQIQNQLAVSDIYINQHILCFIPRVGRSCSLFLEQLFALLYFRQVSLSANTKQQPVIR